MTALRSTNLWFFLILSLNFWLVPLLPKEVAADVFTDDLLTVTLLAAVIFQGLSRPNIRLWAVFAVALILVARSIEEVLPGVRFVENATYAVCFASVAFLYFHAMTKTLNDVTFDTVLAAACAYILIGTVFASVFGLIVEADPTAIRASSSTVGSSDLLFYSFSTITTLGSADLVPTTDLARMMTAFEAIIGLIYVAILVGAVVGSYSARIAASAD